jgi:hypothetical protein
MIQKVPEFQDPAVFAPFYSEIAERIVDHFELSYPDSLKLKEATAEVRSMTKRQTNVDNTIVATSVGLTGGAAGYLSGDPRAVLAGVGAAKWLLEGSVAKKLRNAIADQVATFRKPRVATLMFEFQKAVDRFKSER